MPKWVDTVINVWLVLGTILVGLGVESVWKVNTEFVFSQEFIDVTLVAVGAVIDYIAILKQKAIKAAEASVTILSKKEALLFALNPLRSVA